MHSPGVSLAPKTSFPFPFKRLPRSLGVKEINAKRNFRVRFSFDLFFF